VIRLAGALVALIGVAALIGRCGQTVAIDGGGGSEIVATGVVADSAGAPVAGALVRLWEDVSADSGMPRAADDSMRTGGRGRYRFEGLREGAAIGLSAISEDSALVSYMRIELLAPVVRTTLTALSPGAISGAVKTHADFDARVSLLGAPYSAPVSDDGLFFLEHAPPDSYTLVSILYNAAVSRAAVQSAALVTIGRGETARLADTLRAPVLSAASGGVLLLDDFEDCDSISELGYGWDIIANQAGDAGSCGVIPGEPGAGQSGCAFAMAYTLDSTATSPLAGAAFPLASAAGGVAGIVDASGVRNITFSMRGFGKMVDVTVYSELDPARSVLCAQVVPQEQWLDYTIAIPDSIAAREGSHGPRRWDAVKEIVTHIRFLVSGADIPHTGEVWLDNIRFHFDPAQ
jgi:hypothetical protein